MASDWDEHRLVMDDGAVLRVRSRAPAGARPLLLLHGGLGRLEEYAPLLPGLEGYGLYLVDSRGHGASTFGVEPMTYPRLAADAEAVVSGLGLGEGAGAGAPVVIGHSDGGITGVWMGIRRRVPLGGIITIGAQADPPTGEALALFEELNEADWRRRFATGVAAYEASNPEPDFGRLFTETVGLWCNGSPGNYPGMATTGVSCPALILAGDGDHVVPRFEALALADRIPGARLGILPLGGHAVHLEAPERVAPFLRAFIDGLPAQAAASRPDSASSISTAVSGTP